MDVWSDIVKMMCRFSFHENSININPIILLYVWLDSNSIYFISSLYIQHDITDEFYDLKNSIICTNKLL